MTSPCPLAAGLSACRSSETHRVVNPPLLLQEQLVLAVVIVQALVQKREMLVSVKGGL